VSQECVCKKIVVDSEVCAAGSLARSTAVPRGACI
jgi:hypothetical protein